jgi:molybdopterin molybdotransferase
VKGTPWTLAAAEACVRDEPCTTTPVETVPLAQCRGRFLAVEVRTDGPWPATDRSAMDGFAVVAASTAKGVAVPVVGESRAGRPFAGRLAPGQAVQIMTGAVVPEGADAVVPVESTSGFDAPTVTVSTEVRAGQNIRPRGSEAAAGQLVLAPGCRLRAAEVGALAVLGVHAVPVFARPRVAILATGDEVVAVEETPADHQVRESNSWAIAAQVEECGGLALRLGVAPDDEPLLRQQIARGLGEADVLLTIGGISKGTHDLVHAGLRALAVAERFHGIELKPGKPTWFGVRSAPRPVFVFGLPGNPASCFTVFDLLVRPLLLRLCGVTPSGGASAELGGAPFRPNSRLQAMPAALRTSPAGHLLAELLPPSASGDPFSLVGGSAFALIPPQARPGELPQVRVVGYSAGPDLR